MIIIKKDLHTQGILVLYYNVYKLGLYINIIRIRYIVYIIRCTLINYSGNVYVQ